MQNKSRPSGTRNLLALAAAAGLALSASAAGAETLKVALALPGAVSDKGFNASAHAGLMLIKKTLGDKVEVAFSESVKRPDFVATLRDYANRGYNAIYAHGFQWGDAIAKVAAENPDKHFFNTYGSGKAKNLANLYVSFQELFYVTGQLAAKLSKADVVGAVGGWEIPPIRIQVDAFRKGVLAAKPKAKVVTIYTGTFYDAVKGKEAARAVISQGADIVAHMADATGLGVIQAAKEKKVPVIGYFADQRSLAPDLVVSSAVIKVDDMLLKSIKSVIAGKFNPGPNRFGLASGVLEVGPYGPMVPENVKAEIAKLVADVKSGAVKVPAPNVPALMKQKINKL